MPENKEYVVFHNPSTSEHLLHGTAFDNLRVETDLTKGCQIYIGTKAWEDLGSPESITVVVTSNKLKAVT